MKLGELINIKTIEKDNPDFNERHTRYTTEIKLFSCVQQGDIEKLISEISSIEQSVVTGKLSNDDITQYKYLTVSTITLATRYAIQGGLNEKTAYDFSDNVIMTVDKLTSKEEVINYLISEIIKTEYIYHKKKA